MHPLTKAFGPEVMPHLRIGAGILLCAESQKPIDGRLFVVFVHFLLARPLCNRGVPTIAIVAIQRLQDIVGELCG